MQTSIYLMVKRVLKTVPCPGQLSIAAFKNYLVFSIIRISSFCYTHLVTCGKFWLR